MRTPLAVLACSLAVCLTSSCSKPEAKVEDSETTQLFNGVNLDGWSSVLVDPALNMHDVWSVNDGILICKGKPLGYLHTNQSYSNFKLTLEWRWAPGTEPTNCGVLLRIDGKPETFLPKCVEAQLKHENAGDIWAFYGANLQGGGERYKEIDSEKIGEFKGVTKSKAAEKPAGEWNHYEITMNGPTITVSINGEVINEATGLDEISGPIGLQSEGSEIHFRNIELTEL